MNSLVDLWKKPDAAEIYMIVGWHQWADAGGISSELPQYLIKEMGAKKIGEIKPDGLYLFQVPGTHHFLRPEIKLNDGYPESLTMKKNEFFYTGDDDKGLVIFLGSEPHLNAEQYCAALLDAVEALGVKRVAGLGGVYASLPFDKDRDISCAYSLKHMKKDLAEYAVRFSNYEGGATIGAYLLEKAKQRDLEFFVLYGLVPAYDFLQNSSVRIELDYKAWYDLMYRINHMFDLEISLVDLQQESDDLIASMAAKIIELAEENPDLNIKTYMEKINQDFEERSFMPLDDVWERELGNLFDE